MAEAHIAEDVALRWDWIPMQPKAEDMQLRLTSESLGLIRIAPLVDPTNICIVHDHKGRIPSYG